MSGTVATPFQRRDAGYIAASPVNSERLALAVFDAEAARREGRMPDGEGLRRRLPNGSRRSTYTRGTIRVASGDTEAPSSGFTNVP